MNTIKMDYINEILRRQERNARNCGANFNIISEQFSGKKYKVEFKPVMSE